MCEKNTFSPDHSRPTGWLGKSATTSKLYKFKRVWDAVRGGCMS